MTRVFLVLITLALLAGCQTAGSPPSENSQELSAPVDTEVMAETEVEREEFAFTELPELLRPLGYSGFCPTPERCDWRLPYGLYKDMQGYFLDEVPWAVHGDTEIHRVRFQTGEIYYYFASQRLGGKFAPVAPIIPKFLKDQLEAFKPEPLVACSTIWLVEARIEFGRLLYRLNNNRLISPEALQAIRQLSRQFGERQAPLAERLLEVAIHPVQPGPSPVVRLEPMGELKANDLRLILEVSSGTIKPLLQAQYFGDSWIYLRMLEFEADQRLWQRWGLRVRRHEQQGQVREWVELPARESELEIAQALANARKARVRFEGARVYAMLKLTPERKEELNRMLELYQLLLDASQPDQPALLAAEKAFSCGP